MQTQDKIYALMLEAKDISLISIQYASCLEEAYSLAKLEFERDNPGLIGIDNPLFGSKIGLFSIKTVKELFSSNENVRVIEKDVPNVKEKEEEVTKDTKKVMKTIGKKITEKEKKNKLMENILKKNDKEVLENNKDLFTSNEYKYLTSQIK